MPREEECGLEGCVEERKELSPRSYEIMRCVGRGNELIIKRGGQ